MKMNGGHSGARAEPGGRQPLLRRATPPIPSRAPPFETGSASRRKQLAGVWVDGELTMLSEEMRRTHAPSRTRSCRYPRGGSPFCHLQSPAPPATQPRHGCAPVSERIDPAIQQPNDALSQPRPLRKDPQLHCVPDPALVRDERALCIELRYQLGLRLHRHPARHRRSRYRAQEDRRAHRDPERGAAAHAAEDRSGASWPSHTGINAPVTGALEQSIFRRTRR